VNINDILLEGKNIVGIAVIFVILIGIFVVILTGDYFSKEK